MSLPLLLILAALVIPTAYVWYTGAPTLSTSHIKVLELIDKAKISNKDNFYELGAGTGGVMITVAKLTGAKVVGFELSPITFLLGWVRIKISGAKNCKLIFKNLLKAELQNADVIFCFLMPKILERLRDKIIREARPGTRVVSFAFPMPGLNPYEKIQDNKKPAIYFYKIAGK